MDTKRAQMRQRGFPVVLLRTICGFNGTAMTQPSSQCDNLFPALDKVSLFFFVRPVEARAGGTGLDAACRREEVRRIWKRRALLLFRQKKRVRVLSAVSQSVGQCIVENWLRSAQVCGCPISEKSRLETFRIV